MIHRTTATTRTAAAAAAVLALALGAVACDDGTTATGTGAPAPTAAASTAGTAPTGTSGPGSAAGTGGTTAQAGADRCHTADLKADVQIQDAGRAMVMLTNKGSRSCTVKGYLGYGGLLADNSRTDTATHRVAKPGPPVAVTLKPGTTAFSGLSWSSCDKADASCGVLAGLVVTPPDETTQLTATVLGTDGKPVVQFPVAKAGFTVGTLQPSNQGVLLG
ncbi:DUF4232 domain-containing protein [Kitasatospora sp. DSM 101779]|uniref:DUF4232 domain-containing protein n=1 Tax=Kitasatospora sp. DSM 101779 TaxID=2853165 RepID=UPI0021D90E2B|nr:DUF4232 domain-containing protein [Kitasatospora sp. DSM 101779]MCU7825004.1 DUF4232 domain-containing protein [Kitasatospora sp. DSM 101779]